MKFLSGCFFVISFFYYSFAWATNDGVNKTTASYILGAPSFYTATYYTPNGPGTAVSVGTEMTIPWDAYAVAFRLQIPIETIVDENEPVSLIFHNGIAKVQYRDFLPPYDARPTGTEFAQYIMISSYPIDSYKTEIEFTAYMENYYVYLKRSNIVPFTVVINREPAPKDKPPKCEMSVPGSILNVSNRSVSEIVPIVGADFDLVYSSRLSPNYPPGVGKMDLRDPGAFNQEAWAISVHHYYDFRQDMLFKGSGEASARPHANLGDGMSTVVSADGSEIYKFNSDGRHLKTISFLTGALKYEFTYDVNKRLISIEDANGNITVIARDSNGKMESITAPKGQVTALTIDSTTGFLASITNPKSESYAMTYDGGMLKTFTKPGGQVTTFTFAFGAIQSDVSSGGSASYVWSNLLRTAMNRDTGVATGYNSSGQYSRTWTEPSGKVTTYTEDIDGSAVASDPTGETSQLMASDARLGTLYSRLSQFKRTINSIVSTTNITQTYDPGSGTGLFDYNSITTTSTTSGRTTSSVFDRPTLTTTMTTDEGATSTSKMDAKERIIETKIGSDTAKTFTYNSSGRLSSEQQGSKNGLTYLYKTTSGFLHSVTNARSEVTSFNYNLAGRLTQTTLPDLRTILFQYDSNGNRTGVTVPSGVSHLFEVNAMELPSKYLPPALTGVPGKDTSYAYNLDRQMTKMTRPTGQEAVYNYNSTTGLLMSINTPSYNYIFTYSSTLPGMIESVLSPYGIQNNYTYYGERVASDEQSTLTEGVVGKVAFTFDADHRPASRVVSDSALNTATTNITLNDDDMPTTVGSMTLSYSYPSGRLSSTSLGQITDSRTYDTYGNLESYEALYTPSGGGPAQTLYAYTLTRDSMSRIVGQTETIGGVTSLFVYSFDTVGRLTSVTKNSVEIAAFGYDLNSNRTSIKIGAGSTARTATYDDQDRMLTLGSIGYTYTSNGDLSQTSYSTGASRTLTYDVMGNLKHVVPTAGYSYNVNSDGQNRRVLANHGGVTRKFIYQDQLRVAAQLNNLNIMTKSFVYVTDSHVPDYMSSSGVNYRIITNHLGSPRLVVRASDGVIMQRMDYNVLGAVTADSNSCFQPFGYAGGLWDPDARLVKFGARDYDPEMGRWTTKDPIGFAGGDTNLYGYVLNDPINLIDPEGLMTATDRMDADGSTGWGGPAGTIPMGEALGNLWEAMCSKKSDKYSEKGGHKTNQTPSNKETHENADARRGRDKGGEKGDKRRPYRR